MPSLSSSPRIRSVPQCGFWRPMVAIGSRFSRGRPSPRPERQRQNSRQPRRCRPSAVSGRTEAGGVSSRGAAPHEEPEELGSSSQAWTTLGTPGNLELRAEEQVLHHEVLTATDGGDEGGQDEPEEFEHRGRTPIQCHSEIARGLFAPLQAVLHQVLSARQPDTRDFTS